MSADRVCRVCLADNLDLFRVRNELQNVYEKMTQEKYNEAGYPVHMCYICLTGLRKCHRFMETAQETNNVLKLWYKQQTEVRVARPLYTYSISKAQLLFTTNNENVTLLNDIKVENVEPKQEVQPEYQEYNIDVEIDKIDIDEQTDYIESLVHWPSDSNYTDTVKQDNDGLTDPLCNNEIDLEEKSCFASNLDDHTNIETTSKVISQYDNDTPPPIKKRKTNKTKLQHQVSETSGETAANNETSKITPLNSTPMQPHNKIHRNLKFDSNRSNKEPANLNKIVNTNLTQNKKKRPATNAIKNRKTFNKLALNTSIMKKHEMNTCNYKTKVEQHLTRQIRNTNDNKLLSCDICNYKCNRKYTLTQHIKTHTGEKPFSCDICNYKFTLKYGLVRHMRTHTGEKPFLCDICKKKFTQKNYLARHMRTHTGEKPFSCDVCKHKFTQKKHLVQHMRIHTSEKPFSCDICDHKCAQKSNLKTHMRTHTNEKPFLCDVCDYKCSQKIQLKLHLRTHTGEKPFTCSICGYNFSRSSHLKRHLLTRHAN